MTLVRRKASSGDTRLSPRLPAAAAALAFVAAAAHLAWEASHGGIRSHHLLNQAELPAVSNAWGLLVLPMLGWLAAYFVRRRTGANADSPGRPLAAFGGSLLIGLALSVAFRLELSNAAAALFFAILLSGVALRTYRAEYVFGFVLGMTFVFGSVLPTMVALVAGAVSALAHFVVYPAAAALYRRMRVASSRALSR